MNAQTAEALKLANEIRIGAVRQRNALVGRPVREVVQAIIDPPEELSSMRLRTLIGRNKSSLIPRVGPVRLAEALEELGESYPHRRRAWHEDLRLRDLTEQERRHLVRALVRRAPEEWRAAA